MLAALVGLTVEELAEVIFASRLHLGVPLSDEQIEQAAVASLHNHGDSTNACAADAAAEFGEYPESAVLRMNQSLALARHLKDHAAALTDVS